MNKFIKEGGRSFHENKGRFISPYERGSVRFNDFERGWSQALKRSPTQLPRDYGVIKNTTNRKSEASPALALTRKKEEKPDDIYLMLARRARGKTAE